MSQVREYYKAVLAGVTIGAIATSFCFAHALGPASACEPVVDVEYKKTGKKTFTPQTVIRQPVRDGKRCLLAETGS